MTKEEKEPIVHEQMLDDRYEEFLSERRLEG